MWRSKGLAVFDGPYALIGSYPALSCHGTGVFAFAGQKGNVGLAYGLVETGNALAMIVGSLLAGFAHGITVYGFIRLVQGYS